MSYSTYCGAEPATNGDASTEDYGICPVCGEHCEYEETETYSELIDALIEARKELQLFLDIASDRDNEESCMPKIEKALRKAGVQL